MCTNWAETGEETVQTTPQAMEDSSRNTEFSESKPNLEF
jgi:hypothetical protein